VILREGTNNQGKAGLRVWEEKREKMLWTGRETTIVVPGRQDMTDADKKNLGGVECDKRTGQKKGVHKREDQKVRSSRKVHRLIEKESIRSRRGLQRRSTGYGKGHGNHQDEGGVQPGSLLPVSGEESRVFGGEKLTKALGMEKRLSEFEVDQEGIFGEMVGAGENEGKKFRQAAKNFSVGSQHKKGRDIHGKCFFKRGTWKTATGEERGM